jgi:hypothetical protein
MMELCRMPTFITMVPTTLAILPTMRTSSVRVPDATSADIRKLIKSQLIELSKSGPILPSISKLSRTSSVAYFEFRNPTPERQSFCKTSPGPRFLHKMVISTTWTSQTIWKSRIIRKSRLTASGSHSIMALIQAIGTPSKF